MMPVSLLLELDRVIFRFINHDLANPVLDFIMPELTDVGNFYLLYIVFFLALIVWGGSSGRWCALLMLVSVAATDPLNSRVLKEDVQRLRPCHQLEGVRTLAGCGGGKSFPSSHAANNVAAACVFAFFFVRWWWTWGALAGAIAFSRIYVGEHYPLDVLGGAFVGGVVAALIVGLYLLAKGQLRARPIDA